ncbi:hypothetical protein TWF569_005900 [Orbilia oligospora]|uniref:Uncharacterized protein n=1 Tax=Orbilia oligospora TaxID=2813651 RepID=A0A7C8N5J8_ORBOL|nr:hypothetical protein TWF102_008001 [Orbilia oligospora]KAF3148167.1 hypothetical protein TWF569_005900 [Orbilia oligospora]
MATAAGTASATSFISATLTAPANSTESLAQNGTTVGWMRESGGRGTLTLITTCLLTMFICTWVVIHRRVYRSNSMGQWHKTAIFLKAIVAPEFIAVEGLQEWSQAKKMVAQCAEYKDDEGKSMELIHAFYISMLALRYRVGKTTSRVIWPNQYIWLLRHGFIEWRNHAEWGLLRRDIEDKSNTDGFAKATALVQVFWFVAQCIMRSAHDLPLAPLESMTISYIPLFAVTYYFWWFKPKDIMSPTVINLPNMTSSQREELEDLAISSDFDDEGLDRQNSWGNIWALTPRVFEKEYNDARKAERLERQAQPMVSDGKGGVNVTVVSEIAVYKEERVVAHWDPDLYGSWLWPLICLFGASFGALHLISWETHFPTLTELWLWRASAIASIVSLLVFMHYPRVVLKWGGPVTMLSIISPAIYLLSRIVMIAGAIAAFRRADPALYETYVVSDYWIHIL